MKPQKNKFKRARANWCGVNPVTKVIPDKRNKKPKHKRDYKEEL